MIHDYPLTVEEIQENVTDLIRYANKKRWLSASGNQFFANLNIRIDNANYFHQLRINMNTKNKVFKPEYEEVEYHTLPDEILNHTEYLSIVYVDGARFNPYGHVLLLCKDADDHPIGYFHVAQLKGKPRFLSVDDFNKYLMHHNQKVLHIQNIPTLGQYKKKEITGDSIGHAVSTRLAMQELDALVHIDWNWAGIKNNCLSFVKRVINAGCCPLAELRGHSTALSAPTGLGMYGGLPLPKNRAKNVSAFFFNYKEFIARYPLTDSIEKEFLMVIEERGISAISTDINLREVLAIINAFLRDIEYILSIELQHHELQDQAIMCIIGYLMSVTEQFNAVILPNLSEKNCPILTIFNELNKLLSSKNKDESIYVVWKEILNISDKYYDDHKLKRIDEIANDGKIVPTWMRVNNQTRQLLQITGLSPIRMDSIKVALEKADRKKEPENKISSILKSLFLIYKKTRNGNLKQAINIIYLSNLDISLNKKTVFRKIEFSQPYRFLANRLKYRIQIQQIINNSIIESKKFNGKTSTNPEAENIFFDLIDDSDLTKKIKNSLKKGFLLWATSHDSEVYRDNNKIMCITNHNAKIAVDVFIYSLKKLFIEIPEDSNELFHTVLEIVNNINLDNAIDLLIGKYAFTTQRKNIHSFILLNKYHQKKYNEFNDDNNYEANSVSNVYYTY